MIKHSLTALACLVALAQPAAAQGDPAAGQAKSALCVACHGTDGNSTNPEWPRIAGQHASYLYKQLMDFKAGGARSNAVMSGMVAALSEQDMRDLAAFYAGQSSGGGYIAEDRLALGEKIFRGGVAETGVPACMSCHGPDGTGIVLGAFPRLAGQHATYVAAQLKAFRAGERKNDPAEMMRNTARWLSDEQIEAVSAYVAALH